jgi:AAA domain-containing protein/CHC2-type zinc finger protein/Toprim domain-containing protein
VSTSRKFSQEDLNRWKQEIHPVLIIGSRINLTRDNSEWLALCPFHKEKTPSFKIWKLDDGTWGYKCFGGCTDEKGGNLFQFVQKFDKVKFPEAVETVLAEAGVEGWVDGTTQSEPKIPDQTEPKQMVTFSISQYAPAVIALDQSEAARTWLTNRGITMATACQFRTGFVQDATAVCGPSHPWAKQGWITFPTLSTDGQTVTAVKYRSLVSKKEMIGGKKVSGILRAKNTATMLFNIQAVTAFDDVWTAEGEPDTLVLAQAGLVAVGYPMAGYNPTEAECDILKTAKRRFLAGDNDLTGIKAMGALQKRMPENTFIVRWPNNRKDANEVLTNECGNDSAKFKALVEDLKARVTQTETIVNIQSASDIEPIQVTWMWENKIPFGMLTLFAGDPGNGKSMASVSVAAICSTGASFPATPFSGSPCDVLMLIGEDDIARTVIPRLMAAHANLKRIHFLKSVRPVGKENREVRLDTDIRAIENMLAANSNIRLLTIDPISSYLGDVSMVAEQEVRSVLNPLMQMAERFGVAIILVMHLNKKADLDAIMRVGGAMAFVGVARCSWLFAKNAQDETPDGEDPTLATEKHRDEFSMLRMKNNLAPSYNTGLSYTIAVRPVRIKGVEVLTPYVKWGTTFDGTADAALASNRRKSKSETQYAGGRPKDALPDAIQWLEGALQDNQPHPSKPLIKDAYEAEGIKDRTLRRAYTALGGVKPFKVDGHYCWQLAPMNETGSDRETPRQSELLQVAGTV